MYVHSLNVCTGVKQSSKMYLHHVCELLCSYAMYVLYTINVIALEFLLCSFTVCVQCSVGVSEIEKEFLMSKQERMALISFEASLVYKNNM